jgi:nitroimidazol reductase NimA-like FMN-containing flavoprotein (pyridoxamine 5'-phosphate oxidase superfamily)
METAPDTTRALGRPIDAAVRVRRGAERAHYDAATVDAVLDEALLCHVAFVAPDGNPMVIPTLHARDGDRLLLHASTGSRLARAVVAAPVPVSVAVTLLDGLVLARSAMHHSVNYRSVVVVGTLTAVTSEDAKRAALDHIVDHIVPGRAAAVRSPTRRELAATAVLVLDLAQASAKVRTGGVNDEPEDLDLPIWAGVLPLRTVAGHPQPDAALAGDLPVPAHVLAHPLLADPLTAPA